MGCRKELDDVNQRTYTTMSTLLRSPWILFMLPALIFAFWISWLVVPPIVGTVVPIVIRAVVDALDA